MEKDTKLNWKQACKLLGCKKSFFYNLINTGDLPSERYGRVKGVTVRRADCESYLRRGHDREQDTGSRLHGRGCG